MFRNAIALLVGGLLSVPIGINSATLTVSKDGTGTYSSVQSAVDAASDGDVVSILDNAVYKEQVTIESFKSLTLTTANPASSKKPVITYCDKENVGPKTCAESNDPAMITFDHNGALRIINSNDITIDGIAIDGGGAYVFGYQAIYGDGEQCQYPLQHGNSALVIFHSGNVTVRNSEFTNAYFGIYVKDRNEGGIFANSNPADANSKEQPFSGFGKTGNNLIEFNRIHNNSFGIFFESSWDLGNTVRYNLLFENHHVSEEFAQRVKGLTTEGFNQPGGAILFKDTQKSPVAVYNNTFWHNNLIFAGHWRCGSQHLIFNNIYAEPYQYWSQNVFANSIMVIDPVFVNRMFNCVYACMTSKPVPMMVEVPDLNTNQVIVKASGLYQARIMNGFNEIQVSTVEVPVLMSDGSIVKKTVTGGPSQGNLIASSVGKAFPEKNEIRWLETKFKSTDPSSPDFLVPDWDDTLVSKYILDNGWEASGIKDADGSIADLGAIARSGNQFANELSIKPSVPLAIQENAATARFDLTSIATGVVSPEIKYMCLVDVPDEPNGFATATTVLDAGRLCVLSASAISMGANTMSITIPSKPSIKFGFVELIVNGKDQNGNSISTVGFIPYRADGQNGNEMIPLVIPTIKRNAVQQLKTFELFDLKGRKLAKIENSSISSAKLNQYRTLAARGMYIIKSTDLVTGKVEYLRNLRIDELLQR